MKKILMPVQMNKPYSKPVIQYFTGNAIYIKTTYMYSSVHEVKTMNRIKIQRSKY